MLKAKEYSVQDLSPTTIVLISGRAGVGKSLASKILLELVDTLGYLDSTVMHFAEDVKSIARDRFGWNGEKDSSGRALLQGIGQAGRAYNPYIWAEKVLTKINSNPGIFDFVFIDDWRFPNEYEYIKAVPKYLVLRLRIECPEFEMLKGTPEYDEVSETSLPSKGHGYYDYYVDNDRTQEGFQKDLAKILVLIVREQEKYINDRSS